MFLFKACRLTLVLPQIPVQCMFGTFSLEVKWLVLKVEFDGIAVHLKDVYQLKFV